MIGILGAMAVEVDALKQTCEQKQEKVCAGMTFVSGQLGGQSVVIVQCGIGKVNAAACTQLLISIYSPDLVINVGVGGSLSDNLHYGDIAVATKCVQHDVDTTALGDPIGFVSTVNTVYFPCDEGASQRLANQIQKTQGVNVVSGVIATGDQFVSSVDLKRKIVSNFDAICCDMESGAIAQVCSLNRVPFVALRAISDHADDDSETDFPRFAKMAAQRTQVALRQFCQTYEND
ncbi:MAG: 5'-methylthioadenosine/adenosylhomocysteine nucleosidase [Clostridia bacterium]|nr:5'-methylthioadenosine/adenosylhomocysteine nucleosidase [Clostridia bacterium]